MPLSLALHVDDYRPGATQAPHVHDSLHFSLVLRGSVQERVGREVVDATPMSVVSKDAGVRHANAWGASGARLIRLTLPGGRLADLTDREPPERGWRWTHHPAIARPFLRLLVRHRLFATRSIALDDGDLADLVAGFTATPAGAPRGAPPHWLQVVIDGVRDGDPSQLNSRTLAAQAGVHPVYLARCVRRWYGTTLGDLLRARRLRLAIAALATHDVSVARIAHDLGFADEAHLNRAMRRETGIPPARLRRLIQDAHTQV